MQDSRKSSLGEGADHVLRIRAMMAIDQWSTKWRGTALSALGATA